MIKLYKYASKVKKDKDGNVIKGEDEEEDAPAESRVGAAMSDLTNRRCSAHIFLLSDV